MITINGEICKPISEITGVEEHQDYFISTSGKVYSKKRKYLKEIKPCWQNSKRIYKIIKLKVNNKSKRYYIHRLVTEAFLLNGSGGKTVTHINGDRTDNRVENLMFLKGMKRSPYCANPLKPLEKNKEFVLNDNLIDDVMLLHRATQIKGMNVSNDVNEFFYEIMKGAIEDYKIKYNLNKILFSLTK